MILKFKMKNKEVWLIECIDGWIAEWIEKGELIIADVEVEDKAT